MEYRGHTIQRGKAISSITGKAVWVVIGDRGARRCRFDYLAEAKVRVDQILHYQHNLARWSESLRSVAGR